MASIDASIVRPQSLHLMVAGVEQATMLVQICAGEGQGADNVLLTEGVYDEDGDTVARRRSFFGHRQSAFCNG